MSKKAPVMVSSQLENTGQRLPVLAAEVEPIPAISVEL